jgi:radical SAM protein (TIGR01212 family)
LRKRYGAALFTLYLQAFTNTFAPVEDLQGIYNFVLGLAPFKEFIVSTRPDCVTKEIARLLSEYREAERDVWVELGLQSASDTTLRRIRRGHSLADFLEAYKVLKAFSLKVAVHVIFGLPGESREDIMNTVELLASQGVDGIKIHNLHIPVGTEMYEEYLAGELVAPSSNRHLSYTIEALERLPRETVVMRLTTDTPRDRLAAPRRFWEKARFYEELKSEMSRRGTYQGRLSVGSVTL